MKYQLINKLKHKIMRHFLPIERNYNLFILKKQIIDYLQAKQLNSEEKEVLAWLKNNIFNVFPYDFIYKYNHNNIEILVDDELKRKYVMFNNKKMYFKENMDDNFIKGYVSGILLEQDNLSPHKYIIDESHIKGKIVADLGVAEGNFALSIIDSVEKIYLFECDDEWVEALKLTFEPWKDKVVIVNKFISDINSDTHITLDEFFKDKQIDYIKADIEGSEVAMLKAGSETLRQKVSDVLLCAYHKASDEQDIMAILDDYGYEYHTSNGYMIFIYDSALAAPYLRRGLIYGKRSKQYT